MEYCGTNVFYNNDVVVAEYSKIDGMLS